MLVKAMAKRLKEKEGPRMVLVNFGDVGSEWKNVFDVFWTGDVEDVVQMMRRGIEERMRGLRRKKTPATTHTRQATLLEMLPSISVDKTVAEKTQSVIAPVKKMQRSTSASSVRVTSESAINKSPTKKARATVTKTTKSRRAKLDLEKSLDPESLPTPKKDIAPAMIDGEQENKSPDAPAAKLFGGRVTKSRPLTAAPKSKEKATGKATKSNVVAVTVA
jgi:hypothetical protein